MIFLYILIFIGSALLLFGAGELIVKALSRIARFLGWREFIVAFIMALATSIPNLFVGISSVVHKTPQLSFGDIIGANVLDMTLAIGLAALVAKGLSADSKLVQGSVFFTIVIAILPLILIWDGTLGRGDGITLLLAFLFYNFWLFSKKERFKKVYEADHAVLKIGFRNFMMDFGRLIFGVLLLLAASEGIVRSSLIFADSLQIPPILIGIVIIALGTSLPETYFAVVSARKKEYWLILGNLMGSVIVVTTLVLGAIALMMPIEISNFSPFAVARIFLILSAAAFLFFIRSGKKVSRLEAIALLAIYFIFMAIEILIHLD